METINISIPADWLPEHRLSPDELREALRLGLKQLHRQQKPQRQHREQVRQVLIEAGLAQPQRDPAPAASSLSATQRRELAQQIATAGPLSDIIIADRADRL